METPFYFKRKQRDEIFHFYEVHSGPGKTRYGYQVVLNFLNNFPIISVEHNYESDPSGCTGTWCQFEVGVTITKEEYETAFQTAISNCRCCIR